MVNFAIFITDLQVWQYISCCWNYIA